MIETLEVNNIALIANESINFENGMNVLTGETGAGKSLMIDAIGILLGNKIDKTLIRRGENACKVVCKFLVDECARQEFSQFCQKYGLDDSETEVLVSRTYSLTGKSDIRINGEMSTLSALKELSALLVDAHFQNDNQKIFSADEHLKILDNFAQTEKTGEYIAYLDYYAKLQSINAQLSKFGNNDEDRLTKIDILSYQSKEIEDANISQAEFDELQIKKQKYMNIGKIVSSTQNALNCLSGECISNIAKSKSEMSFASNYDENLSEFADRLASVQIELDDIRDGLHDYIENSDYSEDAQQKVENRLETYFKLQRKYGSTVDNIFAKKQQIDSELETLQNSAQIVAKLEKEKQQTLEKLYGFADKIHNFRQKHAVVLCKKITQNLIALGMKNAIVEYDFKQSFDFNQKPTLHKNGTDKVELLFSANLGESTKSISKIASGGEISRFMLALKSVIASVDNTPTVVFDEIDTGISGVAVEQMAKQMALIANKHQVIVVTHSAQICAMGDTNFLIFKQEENEQTNTHLKLLTEQEKINEVARFLSGEKLTKASLENARELIEMQKIFKKSIV